MLRNLLGRWRYRHIIRATLAWCNEIRARDHKPPLSRLPKGKRLDPHSCPCGAATGWSVAGAWAIRDEGAERLQCLVPGVVVDFQRHFDYGRIPHLVDDDA